LSGSSKQVLSKSESERLVSKSEYGNWDDGLRCSHVGAM